MVRDFERILERESPMTRMKINPSFPGKKIPDIPGTQDLSPAGPLTISGGTISGYPRKSYVQDIGSLYSKEHNVVIQESRATPTPATTTTKETMGTEVSMEKYAEKKKKKNKCNA